jgi:glycosyltransferase involved in cell wall biosynthesis
VKILRLIHSLRPENGGPAEGIRSISAELLNMGHEVEVASLDAPDSSWFGQYAPLRCHGLGSGSRGYGYAPKVVSRLTVLAAGFDAVIVHGIWNYHSFACYLAWRRMPRKVPYYLYTHGMLDPWFRETYPLKHIKKWVYWKIAEGRAFNHARCVFFTSQEEQRLAKNAFHPYAPREKVLPYGIVPPAASGPRALREFRALCPELGNRPYWLFMSRLHIKKGVDLLLEAYCQLKADPNYAASLPDLVLAGPEQDPGLAEALKKRAGASDKENPKQSPKIHFPGMLHGETKFAALRECEAFILPSHQENFGIVVAEALACGRPVAISAKVNIWREIHASGAGFIEEDTLEGTRRLLLSLVRLSPERHRAMSLAALTCFQKNFHARSAAESLIHTLEEDFRSSGS